jgi:hypothetical protein
MLPKIDVLGENKLVMAPPSIHPAGHPYSMVTGDFALLPVTTAKELLGDLYKPKPLVKTTDTPTEVTTRIVFRYG